MSTRKTATVTLGDLYDRIERCKARYNKRDLARVIFEIVEQYLDFYEAAEEAKLRVLLDQHSALGKSLSRVPSHEETN